MPELPDKSTLENGKTAVDRPSPSDAPSSFERDRNQNSKWWIIPNFSYLLVWWILVIGYYVVLSSIAGREHKGPINLEMISGAGYAILASGLIGALFAKRFRMLWFLISIALSTLVLVLMLLGLGTLRNMMNP
jgi:hypothetical protein